MDFKTKYRLAKANGLEERCRGDEISFRISEKYPLNAQIALLMDKDLKYYEWVEYQAFRQQVKDEVDAEIQTFENEINHGA